MLFKVRFNDKNFGLYPYKDLYKREWITNNNYLIITYRDNDNYSSMEIVQFLRPRAWLFFKLVF